MLNIYLQDRILIPFSVLETEKLIVMSVNMLMENLCSTVMVEVIHILYKACAFYVGMTNFLDNSMLQRSAIQLFRTSRLSCRLLTLSIVVKGGTLAGRLPTKEKCKLRLAQGNQNFLHLSITCGL